MIPAVGFTSSPCTHAREPRGLAATGASSYKGFVIVGWAGRAAVEVLLSD